MSNLNFVAFYGVSTVSSLIRYFTRSRSYSHIAISISKDKLIEAWPHEGGLKQWTDYSSFDKHTPGTVYEIWSLPVSAECKQFCMSYYNAMAKAKTPYDYKGVLGFVFKKSVKESPDKLFCSELAITPLVTFNNWRTIRSHLVSPRDFVNIVEAAGAKMIYQGKT